MLWAYRGRSRRSNWLTEVPTEFQMRKVVFFYFCYHYVFLSGHFLSFNAAQTDSDKYIWFKVTSCGNIWLALESCLYPNSVCTHLWCIFKDSVAGLTSGGKSVMNPHWNLWTEPQFYMYEENFFAPAHMYTCYPSTHSQSILNLNILN